MSANSFVNSKDDIAGSQVGTLNTVAAFAESGSLSLPSLPKVGQARQLGAESSSKIFGLSPQQQVWAGPLAVSLPSNHWNESQGMPLNK